MQFGKPVFYKYEPFFKTFNRWPCSDADTQELFNFIIKGYAPGSFHTSVFANDLLGAAAHSHISNEWNPIQYMMKWLNENAPHGSWGDYAAVEEWLALTEKGRESILQRKNWIVADEVVTFKLLEIA